VHNCRLWPGNGNFDFRQFFDNLLFTHEKSCAQGGCGTDDSVAEKPK
jgi:hypothetical protein